MKNEMEEAPDAAALVVEEVEKPAPEQGERKIYVPLQALAQPDDSEQLQAPEIGDTGSATFDYVVESIEGDMACIRPVSLNGTDLEAEKKEAEEAPSEPSLEDQEADIQKNLDNGGEWL